LQAAFEVGVLKPGMFRPITAPKPVINNKVSILNHTTYLLSIFYNMSSARLLDAFL